MCILMNTFSLYKPRVSHHLLIWVLLLLPVSLNFIFRCQLWAEHENPSGYIYRYSKQKFSRAFEDLIRVDHVRSQSHLKSLGCFVKAGTKSSANAEGISNRGLCGKTMHGLWWDHAHWSESLATARNTVPGQHPHRRQKAKSWANRQHGKQSRGWTPLKKFWSFFVFS